MCLVVQGCRLIELERLPPNVSTEGWGAPFFKKGTMSAMLWQQICEGVGGNIPRGDGDVIPG